MPGAEKYKVISPLEKRVYYVKSLDDLHKICRKIIKRGYAEGRPLEIHTDKVTKSSFARAVIYWFGRNNMDDSDLDAVLKRVITELYLLPRLEQCECSERTKAEFREVLDRFISGEVGLRELVKYFAKESFRLSYGHHVHKVKIA